MERRYSDKIITHELSASEKEYCLDRASKALEKHTDILFGYAFGSFVEAGAFRDLDIAIFLSPDRVPKKAYTFEFSVETELKRAMDQDFPVDVRILNSAALSFQYHAIRGILLLDRDPDRRIEFVTGVISRYLDIQPMLRHYTKEAFAYDTES